jgi:hypothetical protein
LSTPEINSGYFWIIGQEQSTGVDADFEDPGYQVEMYIATAGQAGKKASDHRDRPCWQSVAVPYV